MSGRPSTLTLILSIGNNMSNTIEQLAAAGFIDTLAHSMYDLMDYLRDNRNGKVAPNRKDWNPGRGFRYHCLNGWAISVQWHGASYCDLYDPYSIRDEGPEDCANAEVAAINPDGRMMYLTDGMFGQILESQTPREVLTLIDKIEARTAE
jgi:hypothetical protein